MQATLKAALAEALPAALSSAPGQAALDRATSGAVRTHLPHAVAEGMTAVFVAQVVPPLELGTRVSSTGMKPCPRGKR